MTWDEPTHNFDMGDMARAVNGVTDNDNNAQHKTAHDESAAGETPERVGDWAARTPLNYEALNADRNTAHTYEESGAIPVWAHNAAKYEWVDEYGDVGPRVPDLEEELFRTGKLNVSEAGVDIKSYNDIPVEIEGGERIRPIQEWADAGLHPTMLENIDLCQYSGPTPIQAYSIPAVLTGNDLVAVAQTGSGKTAAFLVPILSRLMGKAKKLAAARPNPLRYNAVSDAVRAEPLVLIMCPTRELAMQIFDDARRFCYRSMLRPACLYGGAPKREQIEELKRGCDVLIGTPGRLKDIVENEPRWLSLDRLKYTVIDEADELLHGDWEDEMKPLLGGGASSMEGDHQFLMFSATFPKEARALAKQYLDPDHVRIKVGRTGSTLKNIRQDVIWVEGNMKQKALIELLEDLPPARTLIFCNNTGTVDVVDDFLYNAKMPVTSIHRDRTQREREDAIRAFRTGKVPILVASAVSARGLDIRSIMHVINYDLPNMAYGGINEYVHRIGRTGRIGNQGQATSFYNERDEDLAPHLVKLLVENSQPIPDFLEQYKPEEGAAIDWDDASLDGEEAEEGGENGENGDAGGGGWGDETTEAPAATEAADDGWGVEKPAAPAPAAVAAPAANTNDGWGAPSGQDLSW